MKWIKVNNRYHDCAWLNTMETTCLLDRFRYKSTFDISSGELSSMLTGSRYFTCHWAHQRYFANHSRNEMVILEVHTTGDEGLSRFRIFFGPDCKKLEEWREKAEGRRKFEERGLSLVFWSWVALETLTVDSSQ